MCSPWNQMAHVIEKRDSFAPFPCNNLAGMENAFRPTARKMPDASLRGFWSDMQ